jgi:hypothetical protein
MDPTRRRQYLFADLLSMALGVYFLVHPDRMETFGIVVGVVMVTIGAVLFVAVWTRHYPPWWTIDPQYEDRDD